MKRHTDVSRLRPAAEQQSAETATRPTSCAAAVEKAAVLLINGMRESDIPIAELSGALVRMAQTLAEMGTPLFGAADAPPPADLKLLRDALARDISVCIESLQFHDRLMQQLAQARDILSGLAANRQLARVPNVPPATEGSIELF